MSVQHHCPGTQRRHCGYSTGPSQDDKQDPPPSPPFCSCGRCMPSCQSSTSEWMRPELRFAGHRRLADAIIGTNPGMLLERAQPEDVPPCPSCCICSRCMPYCQSCQDGGCLSSGVPDIDACQMPLLAPISGMLLEEHKPEDVPPCPSFCICGCCMPKCQKSWLETLREAA